MPKNQNTNTKKLARRNTLFEEIKSSKEAKQKVKSTKTITNSKNSKKSKSNEDIVLPKALSQKLLKQVQEQQLEFQDQSTTNKPSALSEKSVSVTLPEVDTPYESDAEDEAGYNTHTEEVYTIDPEDEATLAIFMGTERKLLNLSEIIMQKLKEKESVISEGTQNADEQLKSKLDPKVVSVYTQIADILQHYRAGRLPKAVKIVPLLDNWLEILYFTKPDNWSPQATRELTKIFSSNLNEMMAEKYYGMVLLPKVRNDIHEHKKLNYHYYMALKKALFKPKAFYKGFLIPLCESKDCSLREAVIIGSILKKISIPPIPSSVALMKLALMPYTGSNSFFIKTLIDKKYALPLRVIDALVQHFMRFQSETRTLPVIWHQSLLVFAQRYKEDITAEQKQELKLLLRDKSHPKITPEIRRELFSTKSRGDPDTMDTT